jgi:hypothetical protein
MLSAMHLMGRAARSTLYIVALAALLTVGWQRLRSTHQRRRGSRSTPLPQNLQTWEGEGGRPDPNGPQDGPLRDTTTDNSPDTPPSDSRAH